MRKWFWSIVMAVVGFLVGVWWLREREVTTPALQSYEQTPSKSAEQPTDAVADESTTAQETRDEPRVVETETVDVASSTPDDLTAINGIGAAFETALNNIGIMTYADLAVQVPADLAERLDARGISAERIERDAWIEQAQQLASE